MKFNVLLHLEKYAEECVQGFPDVLVSALSGNDIDTTITLLIPEMNFSCNATIFGFTVASSSRDYKIQIWRQNDCHPSVYYKVGNEILGNVNQRRGSTNCSSTGSFIGNVWCILSDALQLSVQPGDILGLEIPNNDDVVIRFGIGGPTNYVFQGRLDSTIDLRNETSYTTIEQFPQIIFNLTSGKSSCCIH